MHLCLFQPNKSKYKCVSASEPRRKGADASAPRLAEGKCPASLFPTSSFPVCGRFLSCCSPPSGPRCRLPEPPAQSAETRAGRRVRVFADGAGRGWFVCLENSAERTRCEAAGRSASHVSYRNLLFKFLAAVDHLTESWKGLLNVWSQQQWAERVCFLPRFPGGVHSLLSLSVVLLVLQGQGQVRSSKAGSSLALSLPLLLFLSAEMFLLSQRISMNDPELFPVHH